MKKICCSENIKETQGLIPEFSSGSSTHAVSQEITKQPASKTLKQVQGLSNWNNNAFTLIELLVVVLIIGILAAIALPQYQKAVRRARLTEAKVILKNLTDAQDMYYLRGGTWPGNTLEEWNGVLDVQIPSSTNWLIYADECIPGEGTVEGCTNLAEPLWETGYWIRFSSKNYEGGIWLSSRHFVCEGNEKKCTDFGGVENEAEGNYILP